jgi:hypothetical protein
MNQPETASSSSSPTSSKRRDPSVWEIYFPRRVEGHQDSVYVASFPEIIYLWPTIIVLFLCAFFQGAFGLSPVALGWLTIIVISFNLLVFVQDFDQKKFIIFVLALLAFVLITWIINLYGFTFLKRIAHWIFSFEPQFSTDAYMLLGIIMLLLFGWGIIAPRFSYWQLEQNEFIHYSQPAGRDMSIARAGCTIYKEIPDVLECIIGFGAGKLVIRKDNQILATIPNIPFLTLRMEAIEHMLSETRVIVDKES